MSCDLRVATERAKFGMPEVKVGIPSVVEAALIPRLIGFGRARELVLLGEVIDADTALRWGLIERMVEPSALDREVESIVNALLQAGAKAVRQQKALIRAWENYRPMRPSPPASTSSRALSRPTSPSACCRPSPNASATRLDFAAGIAYLQGERERLAWLFSRLAPKEQPPRNLSGKRTASKIDL